MRRTVSVVVVMLAVGLSVIGWADERQTTSRAFQLRYVSISDATQAVQPLLSESGSMTVQPHKSRITVQDTPEIVERVAEVLAELDRSPASYKIEVTLLQGTKESLDASRRIQVNRRVERMFPFTAYRMIGSTIFEGELDSTASADLGEGYHLSFLPTMLKFAEDSPFGVRGSGTRIQLQTLHLVRLSEKEDGSRTKTDVLRTSVQISPEQEAYIGAGASEESTTGLVLILRAGAFGGH
jgi:hypothetical protein